MLAAQGPECAADFAEEAIPLIFIDAHYFIEQAKVIATLASHGAEGHHVLRKAGAAVANTGVQKSWADTGIGADAVANLVDIGAHGFADGSDRVNEGNLHGQKRVGGMLDKLCALRTSHDDGRGD